MHPKFILTIYQYLKSKANNHTGQKTASAKLFSWLIPNPELFALCTIGFLPLDSFLSSSVSASSLRPCGFRLLATDCILLIVSWFWFAFLRASDMAWLPAIPPPAILSPSRQCQVLLAHEWESSLPTQACPAIPQQESQGRWKKQEWQQSWHCCPEKPLATAHPLHLGDNGYKDESQLLFKKTYLPFSLENDLKMVTMSLL